MKWRQGKIPSGKKAWADPDSAGRSSALTSWNENEKIQTRHRQSGRQVLDEITLWGHLCRSIVSATNTQKTNCVTATRCIWLVDVVKHKLRKLNDTVVIVTVVIKPALKPYSSWAPTFTGCSCSQLRAGQFTRAHSSGQWKIRKTAAWYDFVDMQWCERSYLIFFFTPLNWYL